MPGVARAADLGSVEAGDLLVANVSSSVAANPVSYEQTLTSETALQYCATVTVTNHSDQAVSWEITLNISQQPYNATSLASSYNVATVSFQPDLWRVRGVDFNAALAAGASYTWGYCGNRSASPPADADSTAVVTSSGGGQYCADVTVTTSSTAWVHWRTTIGHTTAGLTDNNFWLAAAPTSFSNATSISFDGATGDWVVSGSGSNEYVRSGTNAVFNFCAPMSAASPLVDATAQREHRQLGRRSVLRRRHVSTTSTTFIKWRATIDHTTPGVSGNVYWLTAQPSNYWNATSVSFTAGTGAWVVTGVSGNNELVKAGQPVTWGFCAPTNASADLVDAIVSAHVDSSGGGHYCASVTVSTTSTDFVKWRATIDHTTPGLTGSTYWLTSEPTNVWNAARISFVAGTGTWQLHGLSYNELIKAGSPQTFGYCT